MKVDSILVAINKHKPCSRAQLYTYLKTLGIKPAGARQRPQLYPADTAERVLQYLGILQPHRHIIISGRQLRRERRAA